MNADLVIKATPNGYIDFCRRSVGTLDAGL
jgi:hypothetical protein